MKTSITSVCYPWQLNRTALIDSLGLSIFLASVLRFNPQGTLVILDDVFTSIDSQHKHRVAALLNRKFKNYQLIVTTHDEGFARDILRSAEVSSVRKEWKPIHYAAWDILSGPTTADFNDILEKALLINEFNYKDSRSTLRKLSESFLLEFMSGMQMLVPFSYSNRFTAETIIVHAKINEKNEATKQILKRTCFMMANGQS